MSLLTPTEAVTFQTFLSSVDFTESYNGPTPAEWMLLHHGVRHPDDPKPCPEAPRLKKATLDLMSLDGSDPNDVPPPTESWHKSSAYSKQAYPYHNPPDRGVSSNRPSLLIENVRQIYPPHSSSSNSPPSEGGLPMSTSPYPSTSSDVLRSSSSRLPTRSSSKRSFDNVSPSASIQPPPSTPYPSASQRTKRSRQSPTPLQRISDPSQPSGSSSRHHAQTHEGASSSSSRSQLLSASQKRANHIQSEQKRRANIRRGYEALCETVPALREAIRKEEEETAATLVSAGSSPRNSSRKKKAKNSNDDGEKIDGRAGPRSENIVLQKTIDYIQELNATRDDLLRRLAQTRATLSPDHPLLIPPGDPDLETGQTIPLWEREWTYSPDADDEGSEDEAN